MFERAGARAVRTLLASGNVLFAADNVGDCVARVAVALSTRAGKPMAVMVRSLAQLRSLVASAPFGAGAPTPDEVWYVSFLDRAPTPRPTLPLTVRTGDVTYVALRDLDLCGRVTRQPGKPSTEHYAPEALFKVSATTRNWNTILKLIAEKR